MILLHKKGSKTEFGKYHISLVLHAAKVLLKVVARSLRKYSEAKGLLPEEHCGFRPGRSTTDMMLVVMSYFWRDDEALLTAALTGFT